MHSYLYYDYISALFALFQGKIGFMYFQYLMCSDTSFCSLAVVYLTSSIT